MYKKCVNIVISNKCNNNCIVCPVRWEKAPTFNPDSQALIRKIKKKHILQSDLIAFTGGEPTLNPELLDILRAIKSDLREREFFLLTNGRMFAYPDYVTKLTNLNIKKLKIAIPIHGHTPEIHDSITRVKGSFKQTIQGVNNFKNNNSVCLEIRIIINKINSSQLVNISKFIVKNFPSINYIVFIAMDMEGEALKNSSRIFSSYGDFMPYLSSALEYLKNADKAVRLYHFPLCTLKSKFWPLAWNSLEQKDICLLAQCRSCDVKKYCPKILKTYRKFKSDDEFKPIKLKNFYIIESSHPSEPIRGTFSFDNINSYHDNAYRTFNNSLPDFLAVKNDLKPMARFECVDIREFLFFKKLCKKSGIYAELSKKKILSPRFGSKAEKNDPKNGLVTPGDPASGTLYVYASKNRELALYYSEFDPELTISRLSRLAVVKFAKSLGYPTCCIDNYLDQTVKKFEQNFSFLQSYSFYSNNFLRNVSNYYLSFHNPCSGKCQRTIQYNRQILDCINHEIPIFARRIKNVLTRPLLIFVPKSSFNYDKRIVILFDGPLSIDGNKISYSNCYILKSSSFNDSIANEFIFDLSEFRKARKAIISQGRIDLLRNGSKIHSIRQDKEFKISFIKFDYEKDE